MDDFSTPNVTNNYGIPPSQHNFIVPGKRPTSSMAPSIIVDSNNKVKLVLGASGGPRIISAVAYVSFKVQKSLEDSLDSIPSPSLSGKIQIMSGKVGLMCECKTLLGFFNKLFVQQCPAMFFKKNENKKFKCSQLF